MSYITKNTHFHMKSYDLDKVNNAQPITVYTKTNTKTMDQFNEENAILRQQMNPNLGYSTVYKQMYFATAYITYPGVVNNRYIITTEGVIIDMWKNCYVTPFNHSDGYKIVYLYDMSGNGHKFMMHRLVGYQFCNPPADFRHRIVNHISRDKTDNRVCNLEWVTVAQNNQHSVHFLHDTTTKTFVNKNTGRPIVNEDFVRYVCEQFVAGKSNTQIMKEMGMEICNANHTLLRDIRGGYTWKDITCDYVFHKSSKNHAYDKEQKEKIKSLLISGLSVKDIFKEMQGREYVAATDRLDSSYRTIQTIEVSLKNKRLI